MTDIDSAVERVKREAGVIAGEYVPPTYPGTEHGRAIFAADLRTILAALSREKARADEAKISDDLAHGEMRSLAAELAAATRELTRLRAIEAAGRAALEEIANGRVYAPGTLNMAGAVLRSIAREALAVKPAGGAE